MALRVEAFIGPQVTASHFHAPTDAKQCQHIRSILLANSVLGTEAAFADGNGGISDGSTFIVAAQHAFSEPTMKEFHRYVGAEEATHSLYALHLKTEAAARGGSFRTGAGEIRHTGAISLPVEVWCDLKTQLGRRPLASFEAPSLHELLMSTAAVRNRFPLTTAALDRAAGMAYTGDMSEVVPSQAFAPFTQTNAAQLRAVDCLASAVAQDTIGGTMGREMRRILASDQTADYHIASMIEKGTYLVARTAVAIMVGLYPVGALVAAVIRQFRDGVQDRSITALLSVGAGIQLRRDGKLCILGSIDGIDRALAEADHREDWGTDAEVVYRKLLAAMVD